MIALVLSAVLSAPCEGPNCGSPPPPPTGPVHGGRLIANNRTRSLYYICPDRDIIRLEHVSAVFHEPKYKQTSLILPGGVKFTVDDADGREFILIRSALLGGKWK